MEDAELRALLAAQARLIAELSERIAPTRAQVAVAEIYRQYEIAQRHRAGWRSAGVMLTPFVALLAARDGAELTVADWTAYRVGRPALAPSSLNQTLKYVKAMLRWAKREGLIAAVPSICDARKQPAKKGRETAPTEIDNGALLHEATSARDRVIVLCAVDAGLRNSEIRTLAWPWIDKTAMVIRLPGAVTKGHKARVVPMTGRLLKAIEAIPRDIRSPLVLRSPRTGRAYSQGHMTNMWGHLAELAGIVAATGEKRVRLHDGRHGFATNAAERGVRIEVLSEILGHSSLEQTRAYVQRRSGDLGVARALFEAGIKRGR